MDTIDPEISPDEESQLLAKFIYWWIEIHQEEQERVEIVELHFQLDQRYKEIDLLYQQIARHQYAIEKLYHCLNHLIESRCMFMLEESDTSFLFTEVTRSLAYEIFLSSKVVHSDGSMCSWTFFGVTDLYALKRSMGKQMGIHIAAH